MLPLKVLPPAEAPSPPGPDSAGVNTWREGDGSLVAFGGSDDRSHWMAFPGIGVFRFTRYGDPVTAHPEPSADLEAVRDTFRRSVLPMALQALGRQVLHASAVLGPRGVVALCAVSETGKSTLAHGLAERGHRLWADDAVAFLPAGDEIQALPLPFALRLRPDSASHFGVSNGRREIQTPEAAPLDTVCVLEPSREEHLQVVEPLTGSDAFPTVLAHAYCFTLDDPDRNRETVETYLELTRRARLFRVRVERGLDRLTGILDALEAAVFSNAGLQR